MTKPYPPSIPLPPVRVPPVLKAELEEIARREGRSLSDLVRELVRDGVRRRRAGRHQHKETYGKSI